MLIGFPHGSQQFDLLNMAIRNSSAEYIGLVEATAVHPAVASQNILQAS